MCEEDVALTRLNQAGAINTTTVILLDQYPVSLFPNASGIGHDNETRVLNQNRITHSNFASPPVIPSVNAGTIVGSVKDLRPEGLRFGSPVVLGIPFETRDLKKGEGGVQMSLSLLLFPVSPTHTVSRFVASFWQPSFFPACTPTRFHYDRANTGSHFARMDDRSKLSCPLRRFDSNSSILRLYFFSGVFTDIPPGIVTCNLEHFSFYAAVSVPSEESSDSTNGALSPCQFFVVCGRVIIDQILQSSPQVAACLQRPLLVL